MQFAHEGTRRKTRRNSNANRSTGFQPVLIDQEIVKKNLICGILQSVRREHGLEARATIVFQITCNQNPQPI